MHIGDMNLNHRSSDRPDRILQGNGRMGIGPRIQDDAVRIKTHLAVSCLSTLLRCWIGNSLSVHPAYFTESGKVVVKSNTAINGRFAFTQQIYIGAV